MKGLEAVFLTWPASKELCMWSSVTHVTFRTLRQKTIATSVTS